MRGADATFQVFGCKLQFQTEHACSALHVQVTKTHS